jgi:hypothetical protein
MRFRTFDIGVVIECHPERVMEAHINVLSIDVRAPTKEDAIKVSR